MSFKERFQSSRGLWQPRGEIEHHLLHIFIVLLRSKCCSVKDGAHTWCVNSWILITLTQHIQAPLLTKVLCFSTCSAVTWSKYATECLISTWELPHIIPTIIPSVSLASKTLSIPQHRSLLVLHTESVRHCGTKGSGLWDYPTVGPNKFDFSWPL